MHFIQFDFNFLKFWKVLTNYHLTTFTAKLNPPFHFVLDHVEDWVFTKMLKNAYFKKV
jgi:hypothetical protein